MSAPWTEAHRREADARAHEIAAEFARAGKRRLSIGWPVDAEGTWREWLGACACLDDARIDREVRRVRGLAEGRLVREQGERWEVAFPPHHGRETYDREQAHRRAKHFPNGVVLHVRVTRIRRAS